MTAPPRPMRIGVVLSAGGLRGAAHLGVLQRIVETGMPIDVLVGASAGAIIATYYAAVGLTVEDMIRDAPAFKGRHLLMYGLASRSPALVRPAMEPFCGIIPRRLSQLDAGRFDQLHHRVRTLGIVCHDVVGNQPCYFSSDHDQGVRVADVARASAAVPGMFKAITLRVGDRDVRLIDGGISDGLPVDFTRATLGSTHLVVSDCRRLQSDAPAGDNIVSVRPVLDGIEPFRSPAASLTAAVAAGRAAVTEAMLARIRGWAEHRNGSCRESA